MSDPSNSGAVYFVVQGLLALLAYNRWSEFRKKSVEALKVLRDPKAIGVLALVSRDRHLHRRAVDALSPLLKQIDSEERFVPLTPEQMGSLLRLLTLRDDGFRLNLIQALAYIGDEKALQAIESLAGNDEETDAVRWQAADVLPEMRKRVQRRAESRVLLRAVSPEAEAATLLRAADPHPDLPNEQLMRPTE
jgi:HEAT repeat protein